MTSGVRLGSRPARRAASARPSSGRSARLIAEVLDGLAAQRRDGQRRGRGGGAEQGGALCARFPIYPRGRLSTREEKACAARSAACRGYPGQGFAADRRSRRDPPPALLSQLRRALHHLRARAAARADRGQEERPARALRPRQAGALDPDRAAQAAGRARARRARSSTRSCASSKARARPRSRAT